MTLHKVPFQENGQDIFEEYIDLLLKSQTSLNAYILGKVIQDKKLQYLKSATKPLGATLALVLVKCSSELIPIQATRSIYVARN